MNQPIDLTKLFTDTEQQLNEAERDMVLAAAHLARVRTRRDELRGERRMLLRIAQRVQAAEPTITHGTEA